ncbi:MAG: transcriptional regulator [Thermofilum sp. ex4484_15]|nr:MAG: transcriptional regulator [Thermofilum sp. ex4484_15]
MSRDQIVGLIIMILSTIIAVVYVYALLNPKYAILVLKLTAGVLVLTILFIIGWIGYTLVTTPPPPIGEES